MLALIMLHRFHELILIMVYILGYIMLEMDVLLKDAGMEMGDTPVALIK